MSDRRVFLFRKCLHKSLLTLVILKSKTNASIFWIFILWIGLLLLASVFWVAVIGDVLAVLIASIGGMRNLCALNFFFYICAQIMTLWKAEYMYLHSEKKTVQLNAWLLIIVHSEMSLVKKVEIFVLCISGIWHRMVVCQAWRSWTCLDVGIWMATQWRPLLTWLHFSTLQICFTVIIF